MKNIYIKKMSLFSIFSKSNSEKSKKTHNMFFAFIQALMYIEQVQKKKWAENIWPHEFIFLKKNHVFQPKNDKN